MDNCYASSICIAVSATQLLSGKLCPGSTDYSQAELIWYKFVRRPAAYVNFFKSLLLLHFLLDSFETRYTYFLDHSPNLEIWIFWFSFMNFHQNSLKLLLLLHFSMDSFETRYTYFLGQPPNFVLFRNLDFLIFFYEFSSNFHWNCYCSYNFQCISLKLLTVIISVSLHIFFFSDFWNV